MISSGSKMDENGSPASGTTSRSGISAPYVPQEIRINAGSPASEWQRATPITFRSDWQGKHLESDRKTQVRALWSKNTLYLRFECAYRELFLFDDSDLSGRRDNLWDRDVVEAFLQPDPNQEGRYKEFEVSPNGMWIDLDISPGRTADLKSGLQRSVMVDEKAHVWIAELAIPLASLVQHFDSRTIWRANFFRIEGTQEPRLYMTWQPTNTPQPEFHVPRAFGDLRFKQPPASLQ
jgi:alpha-galactosidase